MVEIIQFNGENIEEIKIWTNSVVEKYESDKRISCFGSRLIPIGDVCYYLRNSDGDFRIENGDYIIKNENAEFSLRKQNALKLYNKEDIL